MKGSIWTHTSPRVFAVGVLAFALALLQPLAARAGGCLRDNECKGDRICQNGQCVDPTASAAARDSAVAPVPEARPALPSQPANSPPYSPWPTPEAASLPGQMSQGVSPPAGNAGIVPYGIVPSAVGGPQQMLAALVVVADQPGTVSLDGAPKGVTPIQIPNLPSGAHRIEVAFPDGARYEEDLQLLPGETRQVMAIPSGTSHAAAIRSGARFGLEGGGGWWAREEHFGGGASSGAFANFGLARFLDLRAGLRLGAGHTKYSNYLFTAPANLRFNIGSVYSMLIGTEFGWLSEGSYGWFAFYGGEVSFATFRFGSKRQFEIGLVHGVGMYTRSSGKVFGRNNVLFSFLFL
jgi:hypothetical protein